MALKQRLWNYQITVEFIDVVEGTVVNQVFDRLNRNSRKLTRQELRHAKFEGWFINEVEAESTREEWRELGVVTTARIKRMADSQFMSELMLVVLEGRELGFDQDELDELYAKYDDPPNTAPELNQDAFGVNFARTKDYILQMEREGGLAVTKYATGYGNFYTLWALIALADSLPIASELARRYASFMEKVNTLSQQEDLDGFLREQPPGEYTLALAYHSNYLGASTDLDRREERLTALRSALLPR